MDEVRGVVVVGVITTLRPINEENVDVGLTYTFCYIGGSIP